eukprot:4586566-Amphidinium_carterae.1
MSGGNAGNKEATHYCPSLTGSFSHLLKNLTNWASSSRYHQGRKGEVCKYGGASLMLNHQECRARRPITTSLSLR